MAVRRLLLGIDAGTSVVKAVVYQMDGTPLAMHSTKTKIRSVHPLWMEVDMNEVWSAVVNTVSALIHSASIRPGEILAIGVTGQGDGCWLVTAEGLPVRSAILWADGRAADQVDNWFTDGTAASAFSVNGSVVFPGAQAAILHWLKRKEPESLEKSRWALYCKDWLHLNLTGELCTDPSDASLPFFDIAKRAYDPHLLSLYGIEDLEHLLPPVRPATRVGGRLRKKVAEQMGLSPNTPVVSGPFDIPACSIGSGAIRDGEGYTILGSTCLSGLVMSRCYLEPRNVGMTLCHRDPDKWLRVMGVMMGTPNLDWFLSHLGGNLQSEAQKRKRSVFQQMEEAIAKVPAGAGGVLYLPYLSPSGERAPFVKASARAQFSGLTVHHTDRHLLRAVLEGVAFSIRDSYEHMPVSVHHIKLSGGGARSALWAQIIADVTGKAVSIPAVEETGTLGAALNAAVAVGLFSSIEDAVQCCVGVSRRFEPDPKNRALYDELFGLYRRTYKTMWELWDHHQRAVGSRVLSAEAR